MMERSKLVAWLLVLLVAAPAPVVAPRPLFAQQPAAAPLPGAPPQGAGGAVFTAEQLEQLTAPIALYPDPLLAQILMASTYPLEVAQAARFMKGNPKIQGAQLDEKLKDQTWDDSVKSLCSFPQVLELMDQKLDWVQKLGDAVLAQQKDVLDAVQRLRFRAQKEGNLKSTAEQTVTVEVINQQAPAPGQPAPPQTVVVQQQPAQVITIEPTNPQVVYVPSYNPTVVYGAWPYPAYPPAYPYPPGYAWGAAALSFGVGMAVGAAAWGDCDWGNGDVNINNSNYQNYSKNVNRSTERADRQAQRQGSQEQRQGQRAERQGGRQANRSEWQHNPENRRGVQYRDQATQQRYNRGSNPQAVQSREQFRGRAEQGRQELSRGGAGQFGGGQGGRPQQLGGGGAGQQFGGAGGGAGRGQSGRGQSGGGQGGFGGGREAGAFQGMGAGGDTRNFSNRGQSSRQSMGGGGGRGGGGGSVSRPSGGGGGARGGGGGGGARGGGGGGRGGGGRR
jgi:hypothetical protein